MIEIEEQNENDSKRHRRMGGAFDTIARVLRDVAELIFRNGVVVRNRKGATLAAGANTISQSVFEVYHQNIPDEGSLNLMFIGRGGINDVETKNTAMVAHSANYSSVFTGLGVANNGYVTNELSVDGEERRAYSGVTNARNIGGSGDGTFSFMWGDGAGEANMAYVNEDTGAMVHQFFVDATGLHGTTTLDVVSDERTKENIENLGYGLEEIKQLRPVSYRKKTNVKTHLDISKLMEERETPKQKTKRLEIEEYEKTEEAIALKAQERKSMGLIAQEVKDIIPEVVNGTEDTVYSIAYGDLVPILINAVKELSTRVEALENNEK